MATRWMGGALLAWCLVGVATTRAQYPPPGPPPMPAPEPIPCGVSNCSPPVPGPMPPYMAPRGPAKDLELPASLPGAFPYDDDDCYGGDCGFYLGGGAQALRRGLLGHSTLAVFSIQDTDIPRRVSPTSITAINLNDIRPEFVWGIKATIGYCWGNGAVELTGFYLPESQTGTSAFAGGIDTLLGPNFFDPFNEHGSAVTSGGVATIIPGQLASFFFNAPLGFEGNNGLWLQADSIQTFYYNRLGDLEGNYRTWSPAVFGCEGLAGLRYVDFEERLDMITNDNALNPADPSLPMDLRDVATYSLRGRNHIVVPQIGCEINKQLCKFLNVGFAGKAGWGANFYNLEAFLVRGDGLIGVREERRGTTFAQVYGGTAYLDLCVLPRGRLRCGYDIMCLLGVPEVADQVHFDLAHQLFDVRTGGSVFFQGLQVELAIFF